MWHLLSLSTVRFHARQPWQLVLALLGISLGVAVFVGIQIANESAARAFEVSSSSFRGNTTHRLLPVGSDLPESEYERLLFAGLGANAAPIITASARLSGAGDGGRRIQVIGIDPVKEAGFQRFAVVSDDPMGKLLRLMTEPGSLLLSDALAEELSISERSSISVSIGGSTHEVVVIGRVRPIASGIDTEPVVVADIGTVQALAGLVGRISRIDLSLTDRQAEELAESTTAGTVLVPVESQNSELEAMTRAFTTNLTALGLLALVVGMFLVHATMSFSIVQRRSSIATLRALGLRRGELIRSVVAEAAAIGIVASVAGVAMGQALANGLIELVLRTMDDLSFGEAISGAPDSGWIYLQGLTVGVGATIFAAIVPSMEAANLQPASAERRSTLERRAKEISRKSVWIALLCVVFAAALFNLWPQSLALAFIGMFLVLGAGAMCVPLAIEKLMLIILPVARLFAGLPGTMAARSVTASLSRTGTATAALAVAVSTVMSIGLMVGSFRISLIEWLDKTLTADLYVQLGSEGPSDSEVQSWIATIEESPNVRGTSLALRLSLPSSLGEILVRAGTQGPDGWGLDILPGRSDSWSDELASSDAIVVAEPFAYRHSLKVGEALTLQTADGNRPFAVVGIARDYNTAGATVTMSLNTYRRHWDNQRLSGIGVHLVDTSNRDEVSQMILDLAPSSARPSIRSTEAIQRISLLLFDRTFEVTSVLRALAGLVAFFGVLSAILALQLERAKEFAVLRSIGMSMHQLRVHILAETGLLGLAAGIIAVPLGCVLAWLLVFVINRRSFGWTMDLVVALEPIAYGIGLAIGAALLAGLVAAFAGLRIDVGANFRDE
jgi:putative ABC transport system permease protein